MNNTTPCYVVVRDHAGQRTYQGTENHNRAQIQYKKSIDSAIHFTRRAEAQAWADHGNAVMNYVDGPRQGIPGVYSVLEVSV
jgi:hypothetical protein